LAKEIRSRVFSGIQPSGNVHLGNYLGAIKGWVKRQSEKDNFFCIVDLHALTVPNDPKELHKQTRELSAMLFACGLEPEKCTVFIQSHVSCHSEGAWILNCITPLGWLERMTQYKDKSKGKNSISTGLLDYPVLMAADILLYDANEVPVGEDQKQHVELARDIALRFNSIYDSDLIVPEPIIPEVGARVMGLDNPLVKMSKTYSDVRGHAIGLLDEDKEIERSIKRAVTDSGNDIRFSDVTESAGVNNLLSIYRVITEKSEVEIESEFANARGYGDLKKRVAEVVIEELNPIKDKYNKLMSDVGELDRLLFSGAQKAEEISMARLNQIKQTIGLVLPNH